MRRIDVSGKRGEVKRTNVSPYRTCCPERSDALRLRPAPSRGALRLARAAAKAVVVVAFPLIVGVGSFQSRLDAFLEPLDPRDSQKGALDGYCFRWARARVCICTVFAGTLPVVFAGAPPVVSAEPCMRRQDFPQLPIR